MFFSLILHHVAVSCMVQLKLHIKTTQCQGFMSNSFALHHWLSSTFNVSIIVVVRLWHSSFVCANKSTK